MDALVPRLLGGHLMALASQLFAQCGQVGTVVVFGIAHQQVQAGLADTCDQSRTFECQLLRLVRVNYHEAAANGLRSEEHTSELQSLMRISYAVFCLKKKKKQKK